MSSSYMESHQTATHYVALRCGIRLWRAKWRSFGAAAGVRKSVGEADERGNRCQVDDGAAPAVRKHLLHAGLQAVEDALHVDFIQPELWRTRM